MFVLKKTISFILLYVVYSAKFLFFVVVFKERAQAPVFNIHPKPLVFKPASPQNFSPCYNLLSYDFVQKSWIATKF